MRPQIYQYFAPWAIFLLVDHRGGLGMRWAAPAALAAAVAVLILDWRQARHLMPSLSIAVLFTGTMALALLADETWVSDPLTKCAIAVAMAAMFACTLASKPATEDHLRSHTAPQLWNKRDFILLNRAITAHWALISAAVAIPFGSVFLSSGPLVRTVCNWLVPFAAAVLLVHLDGSCWRRFSDATAGDVNLGIAAEANCRLVGEPAPGHQNSGRPVLPLFKL